MRRLRVTLEPRSREDEPLMCIACGNFLHGGREGRHVEFAVHVEGGAPQVGLHRKCMSAVHAKRAVVAHKEEAGHA